MVCISSYRPNSRLHIYIPSPGLSESEVADGYFLPKASLVRNTVFTESLVKSRDSC